MGAANDNTEVERFTLREREEAIRICEDMAAAPASRRYLSASSAAGDLICLVLEAVGIREMPPAADQWRRAAANLRAGWRPGRQIVVR